MASIRPQFAVFVLAPSVADVGDLTKHLVASGYSVKEFIEQEVVIAKIKDEPPHILIFHPTTLRTSMSEFVESVLDLNPEVQLICIAPASDTEVLADYRDFNLAQVVTEGENLHIRMLWTADTIAENLYRSYQNEHLVKVKRQLETELSKRPLPEPEISLPPQEEDEREHTMVDYTDPRLAVESSLSGYREAKSRAEIVQKFFSALQPKSNSKTQPKGIYFQFLPTVQSLVATDSFGIDLDSIKGIGCRLSAEEIRGLADSFGRGHPPHSFLAVLSDGLQLRNYSLKPLFVQKIFDSAILAWDCDEEQFKSEFMIFDLIFQNLILEKKFQSLDMYDQVTGLLNRQSYYKKLDEELARARRLLKPVSVIKMHVDGAEKLESQLGKANMDVLLKNISAVIRKGGRVHDLAARTQDYEFSIILPHSDKKGTLIRGERLRRMVEAQSFGLKNLKVTMSVGVSEYPTLSTGPSDLDNSAQEAAKFVIIKGGNRVCLFSPPRPITPDFEVTNS